MHSVSKKDFNSPYQIEKKGVDLLTDFDEIYCLNLTFKNDPRLAKISTNVYYSLCWKYLQVAISRFQYECLKDITDLAAFQETDYEFTCDGTSTDFQLSSVSFSETPNFIVTLATGTITENVTDYTYNSATNVLSLTTAPIAGAILTVNEFQKGHFNVDLNYREKEILAQAMLIPFLEENQNRENLLNQFVYGGSVKIHSQAEHLKTITAALNDQQDLVKNLIIDYTYRANLENYAGLGTRKAGG